MPHTYEATQISQYRMLQYVEVLQTFAKISSVTTLKYRQSSAERVGTHPRCEAKQPQTGLPLTWQILFLYFLFYHYFLEALITST